MAGPGGGPPRKSHTKSRRGCKTCKRRHIRCDESFPQCRNCTKHNCRCDYMDNPPAGEVAKTPEGPNLRWTPAIEHEVKTWQATGIFPFIEISLQSCDQFRNLSTIDLRLIHHISSIYRDMQPANLGNCTLWVEQIPSLLDASVGHNFVMNSILSFSATHLAWMTKSTETQNLAYYHRGIALKGLHDAIGNFSRANSDAILAASILLSWQASDWAGWTSLMRGISTVVSSMSEWRDESIFYTYIQRHPGFFSPNSLRPPSISFDDTSLFLAIDALQRSSSRMSKAHPLSSRLKEILDFTHEIQICSATMRSEQLFEKLQPLRAWLFWMPVTLVQHREIEVTEMILLAQLYTIALAIDSSLPELGGAALGSLTVVPIEQIDSYIRHGQNLRRNVDAKSAGLDEMMQFSRLMVARYRLEDPDYNEYQPGPMHVPPHSPYGFQHLTIGSQPSTPGFVTGTPPGYPTGNSIFSGHFGMISSHSLDELSVPASPFLRYGSPTSRPHSQIYEASPRLSEVTFSKRASSVYSFQGGDSPVYSPAFLDDEPIYTIGDHSPRAPARLSVHDSNIRFKIEPE